MSRYSGFFSFLVFFFFFAFILFSVLSFLICGLVSHINLGEILTHYFKYFFSSFLSSVVPITHILHLL